MEALTINVKKKTDNDRPSRSLQKKKSDTMEAKHQTIQCEAKERTSRPLHADL